MKTCQSPDANEHVMSSWPARTSDDQTITQTFTCVAADDPSAHNGSIEAAIFSGAIAVVLTLLIVLAARYWDQRRTPPPQSGRRG